MGPGRKPTTFPDAQHEWGEKMIKQTCAAAAVLLILGGLFAFPAMAGQARVVVCEDYGATW